LLEESGNISHHSSQARCFNLISVFSVICRGRGALKTLPFGFGVIPSELFFSQITFNWTFYLLTLGKYY
jgi:hypothetical protein